jgi:hypothetical protein
MLRLFFFLFIGGLSANSASVLPCTPEILHVQVLPPLEPNPAHDRHILAIELQNRSQSGCQLLGPAVQLLPKSGGEGRATGPPESVSGAIGYAKNSQIACRFASHPFDK